MSVIVVNGSQPPSYSAPPPGFGGRPHLKELPEGYFGTSRKNHKSFLEKLALSIGVVGGAVALHKLVVNPKLVKHFTEKFKNLTPEVHASNLGEKYHNKMAHVQDNDWSVMRLKGESQLHKGKAKFFELFRDKMPENYQAHMENLVSYHTGSAEALEMIATRKQDLAKETKALASTTSAHAIPETPTLDASQRSQANASTTGPETRNQSFASRIPRSSQRRSPEPPSYASGPIKDTVFRAPGLEGSAVRRSTTATTSTAVEGTVTQPPSQPSTVTTTSNPMRPFSST
jgi:hypothetical protein